MGAHKASRRRFLQQAGIGIGSAAVASPLVAEAAALPVFGPTVPAQPYRVGQWLPSDAAKLDQWMAKTIRAARANPKPIHPAVEELRWLIETDPEIYMHVHQIFDGLPRTAKFQNDPKGDPQVVDYPVALQLINHVLTTAPEFDQTGLVGFPINAILNWPMGTPGGFVLFLNDRFNAKMKNVLNAWGEFLMTPESTYVLNDDPTAGWFGRDAMAAMPGFVDDFVCDPGLPHHGFRSWDDFFVRHYREGRRPVEAPDDPDVIANACESAPYRLERDVAAQDKFWLKSQPYSLVHMFGADPVYEEFVGGTVYQAFLSALSYHRWHSPVDGTVERVWNIDGSYYSQTPAVGFDPEAPNQSQGYLTEVAARAVALIRADNPAIGLMAMITVGMAEVSSCDFTVVPGQRVSKGEDIGMFHFGGSTHCLVFRPGVNLEFDLRGQEPGLNAHNIPVRSALARVSR